jgi:hypothetical protein
MASLGRWVQQSPQRVLIFFIFAGATLVTFSWYRPKVAIIYEEDRDPLVRQLNLG